MVNAALAPRWSANLGGHRTCDPHRRQQGSPSSACPPAPGTAGELGRRLLPTELIRETRVLGGLGQGLGLDPRGVPRLLRPGLSSPILPMGELSVTSGCHFL